MPQSSSMRQVLAFLGVAYTLETGLAIALPHAHINVLLSVLVPVTTVTILTFTLTSRGARREMWRSIGLGRTGRSAWATAFAVPMLMLAMAYGTAIALGVGHLKPLHVTLAGVAEWTVNLVVGFVIVTVILVGEEIGWRGYVLPRVQSLTSRRRAAVLTGFFHGCFHLPLILIATTYDTAGNRWVVAPCVVVTITAAGVFYAYLRDRTGSIWPVAIAHNAADTVFDLGALAVVASSPGKLANIAGESGLATMAAALIVAGCLLSRARVWRVGSSAPATGHAQIESQVGPSSHPAAHRV